MKELKKASRQDDSLQLWHHSKLDSQFTQQNNPLTNECHNKWTLHDFKPNISRKKGGEMWKIK